MHAIQSKSNSPDPAAQAAEPSQSTAHSAVASTRLPVWTSAWGDQPPTGLQLPVQETSVVPAIQAKLTVSQPGDPDEQEADRVAEQVMMMPAPVPSQQQAPISQHTSVQCKCACGGNAGPDGECEECAAKRKVLQRQATKPASENTAPSMVNQVLSTGNGQPLDGATRAFMEPRFGQDFSQVRVHTDAKAAESAHSVSALAYTMGSDVVFGAGEYAPGTSEGQRLLAHELTHVVQQGRQGATGAISRQADDDQATKVKQTSDQYASAVSAEQWDQAALILNGFSDDDINKKLKELSPQQLEAMRDGALKSMPGWSDRIVKSIEAIAARQNEQGRIAKLERDYKNAIANEDWDNAASLLNAYSDDDIDVRLNKLSAQQLAGLKNGAERSLPGYAGRITNAIDQILITKYPVIKNAYALKVDGYFVTSGLTDPLGGIASACDQAFYLLNGLSNDDLRATLLQVEKTTLETLIKNDNYALGKYDVLRLRAYMQAAWKARFPDENPPVEFEVLPSRMPGKSEQDFLQQVIPGLAIPVSEMSTQDKVTAAINRGLPLLPEMLLQELLAQLPMFIAVTMILIVAQTNPLSALAADTVFLVFGAIVMGKQLLEIIENLISFATIAVNAKTDADLNKAGKIFAQICTKILVNVILAIAGGKLVKMGGEALKTRISVSKSGKIVEEIDTTEEEEAEGAPSGFSKTELAIVEEVKGIQNSSELGELRNAVQANKSVSVHYGQRYIQFDPDIPAGKGYYAMTDYEGNGFTLGRDAFSSEQELTKTLLWEIYRLTTTESRGAGVSGKLASEETSAAQSFSERAYKAFFSGQ